MHETAHTAMRDTIGIGAFVALVCALVAPGVAMRVRFLRAEQLSGDAGEADGATLASVLGWVVLALVAVWIARHVGGAHAGAICSAMAVPALRLSALYPYAHRTDKRDPEAPYGWVMTVYRTAPSDALPWDGKIVEAPLDAQWFPTSGHARDAAHHAAWRLNGERVPGSSFGWTGKVGSPDGAWRYGISVSADPAWHGYAFEWRAVDPHQYDSPIGPDLPRLGTEKSALGMAIHAVGGHLEDLAGGSVGVVTGPVLVTVDESAYELLPRWAEWIGSDSLWLDDPALYLVGGIDDQDYRPVPCSLADLPTVVGRVYRELLI